MASVWLFGHLFLYFSVYLVKSDECVTYNFENHVDSYFTNDTGVCEGMAQGTPSWNLGSYSEIGIESLHPDSTSFVSASTSLSCGTTFPFSMTAGGIVELNVYMDGNSMMDQISVLVLQVVPDGNDAVVGSVMTYASDPNIVAGWQSLRISLVGIGTFQGYLSIMGMSLSNSWVLIDSFRYIPPNIDEESCVIYEESIDSTTNPTIETTTGTITETTSNPTTESITETTGFPTTETDTINLSTETTIVTTANPTIKTTTVNFAPESTTETTAIPTTETTTETQDITTQQIDDIEECVTYDFESDFDVRFSTDNYLCNGFLSWQLENYTNIDIESPNPSSTVFMTPHEVTSCISSFVFKMEPGGIVEASVFMDPVQSLDHIIILAQRLTGNEYDTVAGFVKYHPGNPIFVTGWNVIKFSLLDLTSFDGYLIFIGSADTNSTVLVDSVRYIPPQTPPEHSSCNLY